MGIGVRLVLGGLIVLAGCAMPEDRELPATDRLRTELPPAEVPSYAKDDRYTFDNPTETWTVVSVENDVVTWASSLGGSRSTMFDPLLPPIEWATAERSGGKRRILEWSGSLFPLQTGNKLTFKSAVKLDGQTGSAVYIWNCHAGTPRLVAVPAGDFAAFPVYCRRNDGQTILTYYAPAVSAPVSVTSIGPGGESVVRRLVEFRGGKGARIYASRPDSLPGGWSTSAVVRDQNAEPRLAATEVAAANPPVGLVTPVVTPAPRQPVHVENGAAERPSIIPAASANPGGTAPANAERFAAHLASYGTRDAAERGWMELGRMYAGKLDGFDRLINAVDLGPPRGVVYRLLTAESASGETAAKLCRRITEADAAAYCRVVRVRD